MKSVYMIDGQLDILPQCYDMIMETSDFVPAELIVKQEKFDDAYKDSRGGAPKSSVPGV